jgi:hypothetical protein
MTDTPQPPPPASTHFGLEYPRYESRATLGWIGSHMGFQCAGCGERFSLHDNKIRKALDAVRRKLSKIAGW